MTDWRARPRFLSLGPVSFSPLAARHSPPMTAPLLPRPQALLLAALCHDIEHPGTTNAFQVQTQTELAEAALDSHVLEARPSAARRAAQPPPCAAPACGCRRCGTLVVQVHHCRVTFRLLKATRLLESLDKEEAAAFRAIMIGAIMRTDMASHQVCAHVCSRTHCDSSAPTCHEQRNE